MRTSFLVFKLFFNSWLRYIFVKSPKTKKEFAAQNLFQLTFRVPQNERTDFLLVLKHFYQLVKVLFAERKINKAFEEREGEVFIYDHESRSYGKRKAYVEYFSERTVAGGIFKEELTFPGQRVSFLLLVLLNMAWLPLLFINSLLKKDKAPFAMLFREQLELKNLVEHLKAKGVKELFYFCIFEKDSNVATLLLQNEGIKVAKIPSEVPLGIWNKIIIADVLCVCSGYQHDEIKAFKKSMFIGQVEFYGPEEILSNIGKYSKPVETKKKVIGFYSTGAWVRILENHNDQGFNMEASEEEVKKLISEFCGKNPEYKLLIYLHPRERWEKYREMTKDKYKTLFEGVTYAFSDEDKRSSDTFELADLGIAFQTTIVYERLYYGFKTLLMPVGSPNFPVKGSNMSNICASNGEELFANLKRNMDLTNKEFFQVNGITHFTKYIYN